MSFLELLADVPMPIADAARITDAAGGAVLVFDAEDKIVAANDEQRRIMPCCTYSPNDTFSSLFWSALTNGMTGNPAARAAPNTWLADAIAARRCSDNLDFVNTYSWGRMLVSHQRLSNGMSIQARLDMRAAGLEHYFRGPEAEFGVTRLLRLRQEIRHLERALDSLGLAVALVDASGSILHANESFLDMLATGDGIGDWHGNGIAATDPCDALVLQQALKHVASGMIPTAYAPIRRRNGDPFILAVSPGASFGTAIIACTRFGEDLAAVSSALKQALGVTPAEAEVMTAIGMGASVTELAETRGVSKATAYQQIHAAKAHLEQKRFARPDIQGISNLVTGIAAITRTPSGRKH